VLPVAICDIRAALVERWVARTSGFRKDAAYAILQAVDSRKGEAPDRPPGGSRLQILS
jgi:hypothetical protein